MKLSSIRKGVLFVFVGAVFGLGCELIVDFDRTKILVEGNDAAIVTGDASLDAPFDTSTAAETGTGTDAADSAVVPDAGAEADAPDDG